MLSVLIERRKGARFLTQETDRHPVFIYTNRSPTVSKDPSPSLYISIAAAEHSDEL